MGSNQDSKPVDVVVHNEDDGDMATLQAGPGTPVSTLIKRAYAQFRREPQEGDRLRLNTGEDLAQYSNLKVRDLLERSLSLVWLFAGAQGGAADD